MTARQITVAVIDDHPLMRRGIADTLAEAPDLTVIALGGCAADAIRAAEEKAPDVFLVDAMMPGGGIEATREICARLPQARIIVISILEDFETVQAALKAGAKGYLTKGTDATDLIDAVRKVAGGGNYVSPGLAARLLFESSAQQAPAQPPAAIRADLTARENQMLALVGQGLSNQEIADRLGLAENTIKHQLTPLFRKLGVRNRTEAALVAGAPRQSPPA